MTPEEILEQFFNDVNMTKRVIYPTTKYCDNGLGVMEKTPNYTHILIQTRRYLDKGCAVYKLIKILEPKINGAKEIYWRVKPQIKDDIDFKSYQHKFIGIARLSAF